MGLLSQSLLDDGRSLLPFPQLCQQTHYLDSKDLFLPQLVPQERQIIDTGH